MQMVNATCDTHDLMVDTQATKDMIDDSLTSYEMESYSKLMKESLVENESQAEAQSDSSNNKCEFEDTKEKHQELQNDLSKMIVRPWEELLFNKK
jgi:hypothetical protein